MVFQSLIGRLVTEVNSFHIFTSTEKFQSLIGRLVTKNCKLESIVEMLFQSLIGRLVTSV